VCIIQGCHETTYKKLTINNEFAILEAVLDNPSIYLTEIQKLLFQTIGTTVTTATIANICIRLSSGINVGSENSTEK